MPVPTPEAVLHVVRAGEVFAAEAIEVTPFGTEWVRVKSPEPGERFYIPLVYCRRVAPENATAGNLPIGDERVGPRDGLALSYCPSDLVALPAEYCYNDLPQRLRAEAAEACLLMLDAAEKEVGLSIKVLSSYRSAQTQAYLCRRKIASEGVEQREVAQPGHSEHQLGTAVDLVGEGGLGLLDEQFGSTREGRWLERNCRRFGFVPTYSRRRAVRESVSYEPWHFRYVGRENIKRFEQTRMNDDPP